MPYKDKDTERAYQARYKREKSIRFNVILSPLKDDDIIAFLQGYDGSKVELFRQLIRQEMKRREEQP